MTETATSSAPMTPPRRVIDVSRLPVDAFDWESPVWWGNLLAILEVPERVEDRIVVG